MKELKEGRLTDYSCFQNTLLYILSMCFCKADRKERREKRGRVIKEG